MRPGQQIICGKNKTIVWQNNYGIGDLVSSISTMADDEMAMRSVVTLAREINFASEFTKLRPRTNSWLKNRNSRNHKDTAFHRPIKIGSKINMT